MTTLQKKLDIVSSINKHVNLTKKGINHVGTCPFHGEDNHVITVNREKQLWYCPGCGHSGNEALFSRLWAIKNRNDK